MSSETTASGDGELRHVVLFGFVANATEADRAEVVRRFTALRDLVPGIAGFEYGLNSSPENLNNGLTHCFVLTFLSTAARDAYLIAPDHVAFANWVGDLVEHVTVVDYWTSVDPR